MHCTQFDSFAIFLANESKLVGRHLECQIEIQKQVI